MQVCAAARADEDKSTGAVLKCLVASVDATSAGCARETGRAARNALQFYQPKAPVTDVCDSDISALCLKSQGLASFDIGQARAFSIFPSPSPGVDVLQSSSTNACDAPASSGSRCTWQHLRTGEVPVPAILSY